MLVINKLNLRIGHTQVCTNFSLSIHPHEIWAVIGANGRGKTTLLNCLAGLYKAQSGTIQIQNQPLADISSTELARHRGVLFQHQNHHFPTTLIEYCLSGLSPHKNWWHWETADDINLAKQALKQVGLTQQAYQLCSQLSGGEQQRLALARIMLQQPSLWLLDEPTNHLDIKYQMSVLQFLKQQTQVKPQSIITSLHDINLIHPFCSHVIMLFGQGEILAGKTTDIMNDKNLSRLYDYSIIQQDQDEYPYYFPNVHAK